MTQKNLNKAQKQAVEHVNGPLLIIAGAGTGKTTVITEKIAYLIETGKARPEEILALTFTDKAAAEMQERVDSLLDIGYVDLQISTFHTFCQRILEEHGLDIGVPNQFKLLDTTDTWLLIKKHITDFGLDYYRPLGNPAKHIHALINHFSKCKDELISPEAYLQYAENMKLDVDDIQIEEKTRLTELANAYHTYNQLLLNNCALDFGDLIFYTVLLLEKRKKIINALQERFKYILIDEFQDVNWAQYVLVKLLAAKSNLTVVGDDDQSIYAFRGSNVSVILRFKDDFKNAKEIILKENYRSKQEILDTAYTSIQKNNPDRLEIKLGIDKKLKASLSEEVKEKSRAPAVFHLHFPNADAEIAGVIHNIQELKSQDKECNWDDFAILVRANSHARPFIESFEHNGIPYEYVSSAGLYRQSIVVNCFNFLKVVDNKMDSSAVFRLLHLPMFNLTEYDMQTFCQTCKRKSISYYTGLKRSAELGLSTEGVKICQKILSLIDHGAVSARHEKPHVILYSFLEKSGYLEYLTHTENTGDSQAIRSIQYLKQFFEFIVKYESTGPDVRVAEFLDHYNAILESGDSGRLQPMEETDDSVNILTIHGSKGLEFKYVFVVNMVEERFPSRKRGEGIEIPEELGRGERLVTDTHIQEERRLFYVAITRAKNRVYFTSAQNYGGARDKKISRFLDELAYDFRQTEKIEKSGSIATLSKLIPPKPETQTKIHKYDIPKKFSFSQLKMYEVCPYKYKLSHILHIPMKGSPHFSFGNTIHNTLEKFYKKIQELNSLKQDSLFGLPQDSGVLNTDIKIPTENDLLTLYEECWVDDWFESEWQKNNYHKKGRQILKTFYAAQDGNWTIPVSLEGFFKIKVGGYTINGRMDRVDKTEDGTLEIIDYKTGASKEKLTTDDKQQLLIYQIAAKTLPEYSNIGAPGKLTFYYLDKNIRSSFIGSDKDLEQLYKKLEKIITCIQDGNFSATPSKIICSMCDFKDMCEFRES